MIYSHLFIAFLLSGLPRTICEQQGPFVLAIARGAMLWCCPEALDRQASAETAEEQTHPHNDLAGVEELTPPVTKSPSAKDAFWQTAHPSIACVHVVDIRFPEKGGQG